MVISLHTLSLDSPLNQSGECLVLAELILPRNGIARKATLKDVHLLKGRASLARAPFYEKALLKEKIDGLVGLKVSVTRSLKHPELAKFARQLLATGIESSVDLLSSSILRASILGDLAEEAADQLTDRILSDESFIAAGGIDLDSEALLSGKIRIPLKLTETLRSSQDVPPSKKREKRKAATKSYKKGSLVGELVFEVGI